MRYAEGELPTDYGFTGQRAEASLGLYDYVARFYDPYLSRFLSADTIVPNPGNPQDLNRFAYVANNPLRYVDPSGHDYCADVDKNGNCILRCNQAGECRKVGGGGSGEDGGGGQEDGALDVEQEPEQEPYLRIVRPDDSVASYYSQSEAWLAVHRSEKNPWDDLTPDQRAMLREDGWDENTYDAEIVEGNAIDVAGTARDPVVWIVVAVAGAKSLPVAKEGLLHIAARCTADPICGAILFGIPQTPSGPRPPGWDETWEAMYNTSREDGGLHWFDPNGGEWRWHPADPWHPVDHWDYNAWRSWCDQWQNISGNGGG